MSYREANSSLGVPGCKVIRERLGVTQAQLGAAINQSERWIRKIETGCRDCSQSTQRRIANKLCCTVPDLLAAPNEIRLEEIEADYLAMLAGEAQAKVLARGAA
jgi:DNA-binding XRE family transcriptional regulator